MTETLQKGQTETEIMESEKVVEEKSKSELNTENSEDTETYLEMMERKRNEKAKRDSFLAQFDKLYSYEDSIVSVIGIIQSSGIRKTSKKDIKAEFQLINPRKHFFIVSDTDISQYWGKCVQVKGKYVKGWDYESDHFWGTAVELESIEKVSNSHCLNSPIFELISNSFEKHPRDSVYKGYIHRIKRPCPDIYYDYGFILEKPVNLDEEWKDVKEMPLLINIPLDTLNFIIENKKKVRLYGIIGGGYAEGIAFSCKEYRGIE